MQCQGRRWLMNTNNEPRAIYHPNLLQIQVPSALQRSPLQPEAPQMLNYNFVPTKIYIIDMQSPSNGAWKYQCRWESMQRWATGTSSDLRPKLGFGAAATSSYHLMLLPLLQQFAQKKEYVHQKVHHFSFFKIHQYKHFRATVHFDSIPSFDVEQTIYIKSLTILYNPWTINQSEIHLICAIVNCKLENFTRNKFLFIPSLAQTKLTSCVYYYTTPVPLTIIWREMLGINHSPENWKA